MRQITVRYHKEAGSWWAESADLAGFSAAANTRDELVSLVREGVAFALDDTPHMILEASWNSAATQGRTATRSTTPPAPLVPQVGYRPRRTPSSLSTNPRMVLA